MKSERQSGWLHRLARSVQQFRSDGVGLFFLGMALLMGGPAESRAQDCNNNGIPDANEMQGVQSSLDFDGVDDYVRIPRSVSIEPTHEMTFEAWVRPDSAGPYRSNVCRNSADFGAGYILAWQWNGAGKLELRIDQATNGAMTLQDPTPTSTYTGQWTHVAFTYSVSANSVKLFVNGVQKASAATVGPLNYSNYDLYIGNTLLGSDNDFDGRIDEVRMWNVARTAAQISANMSRRLYGVQPGLVGHWRFDEGTGQTVADSTLNANHGFRGSNGGSESGDPAWSATGAPLSSNDCNENLLLDECDITAATSQDCNFNGIPDECELGGTTDCDNDTISDLCETHAGTANDCNLNGLADECEGANGGLDMDFNGVPDSCTFSLVCERIKPCGRAYLATVGASDGVYVRRRSGAAFQTLLPLQVQSIGAMISFDSSRNLMVGEGNFDRVKVIARNGALVRTITGGGLDQPEGVTMTPAGTIAVCSYRSDSIKFFTTTGVYIANLAHNSGTVNPKCVAYDHGGNLYVGCRNNGNAHIAKFNTQQQFVSYIGQGTFAPQPYDMAFDSSENLYATTGGMIRKYNSAGSPVQTITQPGLDPRGIAIDETGQLWVTNSSARNIFRFTSAGVYIDTINIDLGAGAPAGVTLHGIALDVKPDGDCNNNGTTDGCDIEAGAVDCDVDGVPDSCQMAANDCNANNVLDRCESDDCDGDGTRDVCEVLAGASDCDGNDVPDECDVLASYERAIPPNLVAHAWPSEHAENPPYLCVDYDLVSYTWSTAAFNVQNPSYLGVQFANPTVLDGVRLWKDNAAGGPAIKDLIIQYTTDAVPNLGTGTWQNVAGMVSGFLGTELLRATAVNSDGTVNGDVHDSMNEGHGWGTLQFNRITATGIRIAFFTTEPGNINHYKVAEFQPFRVHALADCNNNGLHDACDIAAGTISDCNNNGVADPCELLSPSQLPGAVTSPVNGRQYKLSTPKRWSGAEAEAASLGGHLATVRSAAENQWILNFVQANSADTRAWIGFTDQAVEGTFVWTSGIASSYTNWYPGEPNNSGNEDATEMLCTVFTPGTWNDTPGTELHVGVMEFGPITDCNNNGVLDQCDLSSGTIGDCDANGVPDDCQPNDDCDDNGVRDLCEAAGRADCDGNGVTNYCQIAAGATDCDGDWIPDNCEALAGDFALKFDGANDIVYVPRSPVLEPANELTIECWVNTTSAGASHSRLVRMTGSKGYILAWQGSGDQRVQFQINSATNGTVVAKDTVPTSTYFGGWHHIAATYSTSGNSVKLYVDGVLKDTRNAVGPILYTNADFHIGNSIYGNESFLGQIDELRVWNVAKTQAQIAANMNVSFSGQHAGLVGYWKMDAGAGQSVADSSGRGNHGQRGNDALPAGDAADPSWVQVIGDVPGPADCNGNQVPDACDIAAATATDCNANSVPDTCESDCNNNGIADACDISAGTATDCNTNYVPDACDIASGYSTDVNTNGIPDSCEPDIRLIPVISIINPTSTSEIRSVQPSSINAVSRGTRYYIEVWASDVGSTNTGLTGAYTDVNFCSQTTATAMFHGGIFNVFPAGTIQTTKVDEFGGSALPNGGGIAPQWVRVGWIEMNAGTESAGCNVSLTPGAGGVAAFNRGLINPALITFGAVSLVITPPAKTYDLDNNTNINVGDLSLFAGSWLTTVPPGNTAHDFDCDDAVGVSDLSWFATGWNKSVTDPTILYPPCDGGGGGWGPGEEPGEQPTDIAFKIAVLNAPSSSDNRITVPTSIVNINEGQQYYVEVWASDVGDINTGITSAYLDLMLPPTAAAVISINHNGIFTVFPSGAEDEGKIDELGGSHLLADAGVEPIWSRVATVRLFADANRPVKVFSLTPSATGVAAYGRGGVSWGAIELDTVSIGTPGLGDIDADGDVDQADMPLFINVLLGLDTNPGHITRSDMNADTFANGKDVQGFVAELTGG